MLSSFKRNILFNSSKILSITLGIFAIILFLIANQIFIGSKKVQSQFFSPIPMIQHFSFGYQESMANILWIRAIQDFDYCDQEIAKGVCRNYSWLSKMLDAVTDLSPQFRTPYSAGGLALTVIISDIDGATKIFNKGVRAFPKDWPILYRAAYHYLYEVKDRKRAAELLIQAGQNGAPPWVFTLAGRLYTDAGSTELAEAVLQDMIETKQNPSLIKRLHDKIASIKTSKK